MHMSKSAGANRFLLIKAWGCGFWSDTQDVLTKLILAELTQREPIVYWGNNSLYSVSPEGNAFEEYFLPVSEYSVEDLLGKGFSIHPPFWNEEILLREDPWKYTRYMRDVESSLKSTENILVSDTHNYVEDLLPWIGEGHPLHGRNALAVYREAVDKYLRTRPDIVAEIEEFSGRNFTAGPILGIHLRASDKIREVENLHAINSLYEKEINDFLKANPGGRLFLLTDSESYLSYYRRLYGEILCHTDCKRTASAIKGVHLMPYEEKRRKGIEVLKDTYLAAKCDYFLGNPHSNVTKAVNWLKHWDEDKIKMIF